MGVSKKVSVSELCYYLFFSILFFAKALGFYDGQIIFKLCLVSAAFFVFVKIILTEYGIKEFIAITALAFLGAVIYRNSGEKSALIFLVMMIGFKNISLERIMKIGLTVWGLGFGIMVLKSMAGIGDEIVMAHHKFGIDILRRGLGYTHPNVLHVSYAILVTLVLFVIEDNQSRIRSYVWLLVGNVVIFLYSVSYTGFLLVSFFVFFNIYFTYRKKISILEKVLIQSIFPVSVLFSLFAPVWVEPDTPLFNFLNKVLNSRFYASRLYLQENPLTLFGSRISASHTYALDSSYVTLLIYGGLILFLLVCAGYAHAIYVGMKRKNVKELSMLLSFSIAGVIEPFLFNLSFKNLSLLIIASYLYALCKDGRNVKLLSGWDKEINLRRVFVYKQKQDISWQGERKAMLEALIIAMLAGGCFCLMAHMPTRIVVGEKYCDISGEPRRLNKAEYEGEENIIFYGCTDETVEVYEFGSDTIIFERNRNMVGIMYIVFSGAYAVLLYLYRKRNEKNSFKWLYHTIK